MWYTAIYAGPTHPCWVPPDQHRTLKRDVTGDARKAHGPPMSPAPAPTPGTEAAPETGAAAATLYVGNLGWALTDDGLRALFAEFGAVLTARVATHERTGKSCGFGHVQMATEAEALAAVAALNRTRVGGLALIVREVAFLPQH